MGFDRKKVGTGKENKCSKNHYNTSKNQHKVSY